MSPFSKNAGAVLRQLLPTDIAQVHSIESSVYEDPWSANLLSESLSAPMTYTLGVFKEEGECIGYAVFQIIFSEGHLLNLAVAKAWQGKGVGSFLLGEVLGRAKQKGAESIYLEVRPSNLAGRKLYEKFGFRSLLMRERYYSNGEAAIVMILDHLQPA